MLSTILIDGKLEIGSIVTSSIVASSKKQQVSNVLGLLCSYRNPQRVNSLMNCYKNPLKVNSSKNCDLKCGESS